MPSAKAFATCIPRGHRTSSRPLLDRALEVGIRPEWVSQLIRQQAVAAPPGAVAWPHRVAVRLLGEFDILIDGVSAWRAGRAPKRVVELIAVLALAGRRTVAVSTVVDQLWPDADGDLAKGSLEAALHRARKALDEPAAITLRQGEVSLNLAMVGVDLARLQTWLTRLEDQLQSATHEPPALRQWCEDLCRLYPGPITVPYELSIAAAPARQQLTEKLARVASKLVIQTRRAADTAYADEFVRQLVARDAAMARLIRD